MYFSTLLISLLLLSGILHSKPIPSKDTLTNTRKQLAADFSYYYESNFPNKSDRQKQLNQDAREIYDLGDARAAAVFARIFEDSKYSREALNKLRTLGSNKKSFDEKSKYERMRDWTVYHLDMKKIGQYRQAEEGENYFVRELEQQVERDKARRVEDSHRELSKALGAGLKKLKGAIPKERIQRVLPIPGIAIPPQDNN